MSGPAIFDEMPPSWRSLAEPRPSAIGSLWRTREYLRPYLGRFVYMVVAALSGVTVSIMVPLAIKQVVDGPLARGERAGLTPLTLLVLALGTAEAVLAFPRRWVQTSSTLAQRGAGLHPAT